jgi:hypothetical protein
VDVTSNTQAARGKIIGTCARIIGRGERSIGGGTRGRPRAGTYYHARRASDAGREKAAYARGRGAARVKARIARAREA